MFAQDETGEILSLAREFMHEDGLTAEQAVSEARHRLDELQHYAQAWDRAVASAQRAQRLQELWYGRTRAQ
jgi:hypothetical protein